jgi:membrane-associated phospholipid phosphatase
VDLAILHRISEICRGYFPASLIFDQPIAELVWAFAIAISTLLAHQHYLVDVASGAVLGLGTARVCIPRSR